MTDIENAYIEFSKNRALEMEGIGFSKTEIGQHTLLGKDAFEAGVKYGRANPVLQPMETAPKDGTYICITRNDGSQFIVAWNKHRKGGGEYEWRTRGNMGVCWDVDMNMSPIGWTPIPKVTHETI